MVAIQENLLLCCENNSRLLPRQDWDIYREALANGLLCVCKAGETDVAFVDSMEGLWSQGISVVYRAWFSSFACYHVELFS